MAKPKRMPNLKRTKACTERVLSRIVDEGMSLREACKLEKITHGIFLRWVATYPELCNQYTRACEIRTNVMAEDCIDIADNQESGIKTVTKPNGIEITEGDMIEHRKLRIETRLKLMKLMNPKKYNRHNLDDTFANDADIEI